MHWKPRGDRLICERHDPDGKAPFERTEVCGACLTDPGPVPVAELEKPPPPPPKGCLSSEQHERGLTDLAKFAEDQARKLCKGKARINYSTAAKLFDVAIKATRAAAEFTSTRERREWIKQMHKAALKLRGKARR